PSQPKRSALPPFERPCWAVAPLIECEMLSFEPPIFCVVMPGVPEVDLSTPPIGILIFELPLSFICWPFLREISVMTVVVIRRGVGNRRGPKAPAVLALAR